MATVRSENTDPRVTHKAILGDAESLEPSIQVVKQDIDNPAFKNYMDELDFLKGEVEVMILPNYDQRVDSTKLVTLSINGKQYHFIRGEWRKVPRFVLEKLARTKKEAWYFGYDKAADGATRQTETQQQYLRYPHHWRSLDPNIGAREMQWYQRALDSKV